ncbi:MAG: AMP-binding protein, partial [Chloroflexota bacterium]
RIEALRAALTGVTFFEARQIEGYVPIKPLTPVSPGYTDEKMIVFTSGTTGQPKGVSLSHRSYLANRLTFEKYFGVTEQDRVDFLLVNPMHHTNTTALTDWGMRRKGAVINLMPRYATEYWKILVEAAGRKRDLLITSLVARHIDFLESLAVSEKLPVAKEEIRKALNQTDILIGSAPVGPTTVNRILKFGDRLPHVRFGSTETCLQVMGIPVAMPQDELLQAFQAGWSHRYGGEEATGYYIGREHYPFTRVKVVKSTDPESKDYFVPCAPGEPGYLVTQGANIMSGYVGNPEATKSVLREGWYTGLRDIAFALKNKNDGELDYYWISRDSELLVRGGAKYAYEQIAQELSKVMVRDFAFKPEQFRLAVVGLRLESEHEDTCCVTIELAEESAGIKTRLEADFVATACRTVSKGSRPHYIRFAKIPLSFKGAVLYPQLKQDFLSLLKPKA